MISWMQKHRKYLVVTIWISTIAFVGAGFVGWGTYEYGKKSNTVATVGDIAIGVNAFQRAYQETYQRYNQMLGGRLDEATAKKLGLQKQVLQSLIYQALIENFAKEHGIVVSDEEVQQAILQIPAFRKNGAFDKATYLAVLQSMRMKPKTFEASLKKDLLIQKTLALLSPDAVPLEVEALGAALFMADKIRYKVFSAEAIEVPITQEALKSYWEAHKNAYMTPPRYELSIVWIAPAEQTPDDATLKAFYREHRDRFTAPDGTILPFEQAKEQVLQAYRLKASKKAAQLAYIDFKKGRKKAEETRTFDAGGEPFGPDVWKAIEGARPGTILKPKVVQGRYAVIRVDKAIEPAPESFEEAYNAVKEDYIRAERRKRLEAMAREASKKLTEGRVSDFLTRDSVDSLPPLTEQEAAVFLQKLFESDRKSGAVTLDGKAIAYNVLEQKLLDSDKLSRDEKLVKENAKTIKANLIQTNLIARLQQQYPIQIFLKETE